MHEVMLAEYLGLTPRWLESSSTGGSSFEFHTMHAFRAIEAGDVDTVAIVYGNNQLSASGRTLGTGGGGGGRAGMAMPLPMAYEFPSGLTLVGAYAMAAQRHMHEFGTTAEQLASISVQTRGARGAQSQCDVPRPDHGRRRAVVAVSSLIPSTSSTVA